MHANLEDCAVHIVLVSHEHLAEVDILLGLLQDFRLEESEGRVGPTGARASLVLDRSDRVGHDSGEYWLIRILLLLLVVSKDTECHHGCNCKQKCFFHFCF